MYTITDEVFENYRSDGQGIVNVTAKQFRVFGEFEWQIECERNRGGDNNGGVVTGVGGGVDDGVGFGCGSSDVGVVGVVVLVMVLAECWFWKY